MALSVRSVLVLYCATKSRFRSNGIMARKYKSQAHPLYKTRTPDYPRNRAKQFHQSTRYCVECQKPFRRANNRKIIYCSEHCKKQAKMRRRKERDITNYYTANNFEHKFNSHGGKWGLCAREGCNKTFPLIRPNAKYCSVECARKAHNALRAAKHRGLASPPAAGATFARHALPDTA